MPGRFRFPKRKEEETSLVSEATPNTTQDGEEKSSKNGSSDGKIRVQSEKLLEWP